MEVEAPLLVGPENPKLNTLKSTACNTACILTKQATLDSYGGRRVAANLAISVGWTLRGGPHSKQQRGHARILVPQCAHHIGCQAAETALVRRQGLEALQPWTLKSVTLGWYVTPAAPKRPWSAARAW